jgi:signal transduction histidine kinase
MVLVMTVSEKLESSISNYCSALYQNPEMKNESLELDDEYDSISDADLTTVLQHVWSEAGTIFEKFSVAKHALELCARRDFCTGVIDLVSPWLISCVEAGAYLDCIHFVDGYVTSEGWARSKVNSLMKFSALRSRAKSLRNIGHLEEAQNCYRNIISMADELGDRAEISMGFLLIGKLYGNYWGQLSLFSSFVEEAKVRIEHELEHFPGPEAKHRRLLRCLAICHDALGQAYLHSEHGKVEKHFDEAIRLNQQLERWGGLSRSLCHLNKFKFGHANHDEKSIYLEKFNAGVRLLLGEHPDERGLGIRYVQLSSMLLEMNKTKAAEKYLNAGKHFALRYSEHKTLTQAALVESNLYRFNDSERAINALRVGLSIAQKYKLQIQESKINLRMAELFNRELINIQGNQEIQLTELLKRNREIYLGLISEVKDSLTKLDAADNLLPEFELLSFPSKQTFREKLLLDFDRTVSELDRNIDVLVTALSFNERKRQEMVVLEVVNSVARLLIHDYKNIILANTTFTPLQDIADDLKNLEEKLKTIRQTLDPESSISSEINIITTSLSKKANQALSLSEELGKLKILLSERLRRPQHLKDRISMRQVIEKALFELRQQYPIIQKIVVFVHPCDIKILFNHDIMVTVIQNLIRNAVEELAENIGPDNKITVTLGFDSIGDMRYNNPSKAAILSIVTTVAERDMAANIAESIRMGLEGHLSTKTFGCGVGMDTTKLIFRDLMGAAIQVLQDERSAGIKFIFRTDPMNAELVFE